MNSKNSSPGVDNISNVVWKCGPPQVRSYSYSCLDSHLAAAPTPKRFNDGLWAFLPKGEQEDDGSSGPGFVERMPGETRPLTMKNTDNKLIAAAVTYATIPTFKATVNPIQQGFVPGRDFVVNVVQLDLESRVNALRCLCSRNVSSPADPLPPPFGCQSCLFLAIRFCRLPLGAAILAPLGPSGCSSPHRFH